jgi:hypothetical protein
MLKMRNISEEVEGMRLLDGASLSLWTLREDQGDCKKRQTSLKVCMTIQNVSVG